MSEISVALCFLLICLVPFAGAGIALINTGLVRSRNAAHSMLAALCVTSVAAIAYFVCGSAWRGFPAGENPYLSLVALLRLFGVGLAAIIPLGAGAERWRLGASCASAAILAGLTYPLFAHWVWGGGWLAQAGFVDAGGSGAIQALGGLTALAMTWILGSRRGKFGADGMPAAMPGHGAVFVLFGCLLALVGWLGLNSAGSILFAGATPGRVILVAINTVLAGASAALAAAAITRFRFGRPDASLCANGWVGGLAASGAACAIVKPAGALLIGLVAGALVPLCVEWFESHLALDDPGGAISVHAIGGIWGLIAVALFGHAPGQWLAQLAGIATLLGFVLPLSYGLNWTLNRFYPQRVAAEGERQGMDLFELGAGAYPEFYTHNEEFTQR
ncbi:MAG: hypothetical protein M3Y07_00200 [Acidobacteriota bacterium]|nr:hypothetical protein [Acidobacteriota bacterium]